MILRANQKMSGYTDFELNQQVKKQWLRNEKIKQTEKQLLDENNLNQNIKSVREMKNLSIENYNLNTKIEDDEKSQVKVQAQEVQNSQDEIVDVVLDSQKQEIILNKFHEIMQEKIQDNNSILQNCQERIQNTKINDSNSIYSDNVSKLSITESKFADILSNNNISQQDIQRLIKDNFLYFKHYLGYCICFQCDCGMCRCSYKKKEQKKIKFRGAYLSVYDQEYNKNCHKSTDNFVGINKNLFKMHKFDNFMDSTFVNKDKITSNPARKLILYDISPLKSKRFNVPLFDLTTNRQAYQFIPPMGIEEKIFQQEKLPNWINYNQALVSTYNNDFSKQKLQKQPNCKIADQNLFPPIPLSTSQYKNHYKKHLVYQDRYFQNVNMKSTISQLESKDQKFTTTQRDNYKQPEPQGCKQQSDMVLKKIILKKVDQMLKENLEKKQQNIDQQF